MTSWQHSILLKSDDLEKILSDISKILDREVRIKEEYGKKVISEKYGYFAIETKGKYGFWYEYSTLGIISKNSYCNLKYSFNLVMNIDKLIKNVDIAKYQ